MTLFRKTDIYSVLLSLMFLVALDTIAQQKHEISKPLTYLPVLWDRSNGLGQGINYLFIKDIKGFLWVGSMGHNEISRFDGVGFKVYKTELNNKASFIGGTVYNFIEDSLNNIWIGTTKGLSRYNILADTFTNFIPIPDSGDLSQDVRPFWATKHDLYCMEANSRIVAYDIHTLKKRQILKLLEHEKTSIGGVAFNHTILDTVLNCFWIIAGDPENSLKNGILQISINDGKRKYHRWPCTRVHGMYNHNTESMKLDRNRDVIWINSDEGLLEFSLKNIQFKQIEGFKKFASSKIYNRWVGIDLDIYGRVWLSTAPKGILIYDPETNQTFPVFSDVSVVRKTGIHNLHIYCDRYGITWSSYWDDTGIFEFIPGNTSVKRYTPKVTIQDSLSNGRIYNIISANEGKMWIGTADGLNIFDPLTGKFEVLRERDFPGIKGKAIYPLHSDTLAGKIWLCAGSDDPDKITEMVIYEMDMNTRFCRPVVFMKGSEKMDKLSFTPSDIKPIRNGFLLCADSEGVYEIRGDSLMAKLIIPFGKSLPVSDMVLADEKYMFLNAYQQLPKLSYENIDGKWKKVDHKLDSLEWISMFYDPADKSYWVSFINELIQYDIDFNPIKTFRVDEGFTAAIFNMLTDNSGNLWFINNLKQVGRVSQVSGSISYLTTTDGYHRKGVSWSVPFTKGNNGELYVGTGFDVIGDTLALDIIHPDKYVSERTSSVYFRSLLINHKPFNLPTGINNISALHLQYDQNSISIETGIIDFIMKGAGRIRYKLEKEGKPEEWQYAPGNYYIRYDALAPGKYQLLIQSSNAGNEFNSLVKNLTIEISAPFWETGWFRILAIIVAALFIFGFIQFRSRKLRAEKISLEEKVEQRTAELKKSLEDLKTTQSQLIQSEKMASLGELTAGIAHEIQNPLNFVNNFSDLNKELLLEMKEEIELGNIDEVKVITNDLLNNEDKINHHGKRADAIVKGMLQHSRSSTGIKESTDINALADEYFRLAYHGFRAKDKSFNATMHTEFDDSIGNVSIIPQDIGRVILNLVNNAFYAVTQKMATQDAAAENYIPSVWLSTKRLAGKIEIKVKDNGNGIPQKMVDKIFQPFFTTKPTGSGTGLGLSLSYDIITKGHGGELKVATSEGEFTEFVISLPA